MQTSEIGKLRRKATISRSVEQKNKLGQFTTPRKLANEMLEYARSLLPLGKDIRFLDPAFGTGSFYSSLLQTFPSSQIELAVGYEIDPDYGNFARERWNHTQLHLNVADFTKVLPPTPDREKFNLVICNPPYVRHHHLSSKEKHRLMRLVRKRTGATLNGLTGLHCYFLCLADPWMDKGAVAGWLLPSELLDVNYGEEVRRYLLSQVTLLRIHRFNPIDVQFEDALVSSILVWFRKDESPTTYDVELSQEGTLKRPLLSTKISSDILRGTSKWGRLFLADNVSNLDPNHLRLRDFFEIKRGLATGANKFFIMKPENALKHHLPRKFFKPILPPPRHLCCDEIQADNAGNPVLSSKLLLLACNVGEECVRQKYPTLWNYLQLGVEQKINLHYLCKNRSPWYKQEKRPCSPLLCTYMGRPSDKMKKPLRFILNNSKATATNTYLMLYPRPHLKMILEKDPSLLREIWAALNEISWLTLVSEGRTYGGGLCKIEPKELGNVPADNVKAVLPSF